MGKNTNGGNKHKRQKNKSYKERELVFKEDQQEYARIIKQLGDGRFECQIFNTNYDTNVIGKVCGSMRKTVWIKPTNIVLVSSRSFDTSTYDIIYKYTDDEAQSLKNYGEIPSNVNLMVTSSELAEGLFESNDDIGFEFSKI